MNTKTLVRLSAVAAVLGAALSANAYVLTITGDIALNGTLTPTTTQSNLAGLPNYAFAGSLLQPTAGTVSFTASFLGIPNSITFAAQPGFSISNSGTTSFAGTWTGVVSPALGIKNSGTYSGSFDNLGKFSIAVVGQPVPEPASVAALAIGGFGLLRRRRKA